MTHKNRVFLAFTLLASLLSAATPRVQAGTSSSQGKGEQSSASAQSPKPSLNIGSPSDKPEGKLTRVEDLSKICMVTNHAFDRPQIPVRVGNKTYYGCCEMCKRVLTSDRKQRTAVDPVSAKRVDKSKAVIGVAANGVVVYFEIEEHLNAYNAMIRQ